MQQMLLQSRDKLSQYGLTLIGSLWRQGSLQQRQVDLQAASGSRRAFVSKCSTLAVSVCGRGQPWPCCAQLYQHEPTMHFALEPVLAHSLTSLSLEAVASKRSVSASVAPLSPPRKTTALTRLLCPIRSLRTRFSVLPNTPRAKLSFVQRQAEGLQGCPCTIITAGCTNAGSKSGDAHKLAIQEGSTGGGVSNSILSQSAQRLVANCLVWL